MATARDTGDIAYRVRRSARARNVRVNVDARDGVEVVLPERAPERAAAAAVSELRPWIERRLGEARRLGFRSALVGERAASALSGRVEGMEVRGAADLAQAVAICFPQA